MAGITAPESFDKGQFGDQCGRLYQRHWNMQMKESLMDAVIRNPTGCLLFAFWLGFWARHQIAKLFECKVGEEKANKGKSRIKYL